MLWTIALAWGIAVVIALVVLGFCGYELAWKTRRLKQDVAGLQQLRERLLAMREQAMASRAPRE